MKYFPILLMVCLILIGPLIASGEEQVLPNRQTSFFGVYGKKACVMGKVDGSQFETWIYPFKVFHDFRVHLDIGGLKIPLSNRLVRSTISPAVFRREYVGEAWTVDEKSYPALDQAAVFLVYSVHLQREADMVFTFKPDLSPMWPASLGGKYSYWDAAGYFVLGEAGGKNCAVVGSGTGTQARQLPAHKLPRGQAGIPAAPPARSHRNPLRGRGGAHIP